MQEMEDDELMVWVVRLMWAASAAFTLTTIVKWIRNAALIRRHASLTFRVLFMIWLAGTAWLLFAGCAVPMVDVSESLWDTPWLLADSFPLVGLAQLVGWTLAAFILMPPLTQFPTANGGARHLPIPTQVKQRTGPLPAEPPSPVVILLRHDLDLLIRKGWRILWLFLVPLVMAGFLAAVCPNMLSLAQEGSEEVRTILMPLFAMITAFATTSAVGSLQEDYGILGMLRSLVGPLNYLLSKLLFISAAAVLPGLVSAWLTASLMHSDWLWPSVITAASQVVFAALSLLTQVVRMAVVKNPRAPANSSAIWFAVLTALYPVTLITLGLVGGKALLIRVGIPLWLVLSGIGLWAASVILDRMDLPA